MCLHPLIGGSFLRWQRQGNSVKAGQDKPDDGCRKTDKITVRANRREENRDAGSKPYGFHVRG